VFKKCRGKIRKQLVNITQMLFKEQGSVIILVALGLVVLLGCAALVVDIGLHLLLTNFTTPLHTSYFSLQTCHFPLHNQPTFTCFQQISFAALTKNKLTLP
jgi:accessory gene regulator protein AgrB